MKKVANPGIHGSGKVTKPVVDYTAKHMEQGAKGKGNEPKGNKFHPRSGVGPGILTVTSHEGQHKRSAAKHGNRHYGPMESLEPHEHLNSFLKTPGKPRSDHDDTV